MRASELGKSLLLVGFTLTGNTTGILSAGDWDVKTPCKVWDISV